MNRRSLLLGMGAVLAAPAVVKAESLMKTARLREDVRGSILELYRNSASPATGDLAQFNGQTFWLSNDGFYAMSHISDLQRIQGS